ncbi:MAG: SDR family oxidoreductase [Actinomycetales bacterium]|nr:SDR family oxidoreductase [Actinomycetales bacterium]
MSGIQPAGALIIGGLGHIGRGIVRALAGTGARLIVHDVAVEASAGRDAAARGWNSDLRLPELAEQARAAGAAAVDYALFDLADPHATATGCRQILAEHRVDIVVAAAGLQSTAPVAEMSRAVWDRILAVNLSSVFDLMQAFLPPMADRGYGRFISIASVHGLVASTNKPAYVAAKHGLIGLTRVAALEYAAAGSVEQGGVTVNAICPGWVETPLIEPQIQARMAADGADRAAAAEALLSTKMPSGRFVTAEQIGALTVLLCQPQMHALTGAALPVDGGWTAQ